MVQQQSDGVGQVEVVVIQAKSLLASGTLLSSQPFPLTRTASGLLSNSEKSEARPTACLYIRHSSQAPESPTQTLRFDFGVWDGDSGVGAAHHAQIVTSRLCSELKRVMLRSR